MYTTKSAAERAYAAYRAQLQSATTELLDVAKAAEGKKKGPGPGWWGPPKGSHAGKEGAPPAFTSVEGASEYLYGMKSINPKLSFSEEIALGHYAGGGYRDINFGLRHGGLGEENQDHVNAISRLMRGSTTDQEISAWRGIRSGVLPEKDISAGRLSDKAFVSTSLVAEHAARFAGERGVLVEVRIPKGSNALNLSRPGIGGGAEAELLLPRNTDFDVISDTGPMKGMRKIVVEIAEKWTPG